MPTTFVVIPSDESLAKRSTWSKGEKYGYSVVRSHLMIVETAGVEEKRGPVVEKLPFPAGSKVTTTFKVSQSAKLTDEVTNTLESTISTKLNQEVTTALKAGSAAKTPGFESSFQTEVQTRVGLELTESLREGLAQMRRIEIETSIEDTTTVELTLKEDTTVVKHLMLLPTHWDVYLVGAETLSLEWSRSWTLARVRKTHMPAIDNTKRALCRLTLYEPQRTTAIQLGTYIPELNEETYVDISPLDGKIPRRKIPVLTPLKDLAKIAFPTTAEVVSDFVTGKKRAATGRRKQASSKALKASSRRSSTKTGSASRAKAAGQATRHKTKTKSRTSKK